MEFRELNGRGNHLIRMLFELGVNVSWQRCHFLDMTFHFDY